MFQGMQSTNFAQNFVEVGEAFSSDPEFASYFPFQISSVEDDRFYSSPGDLTGYGGLMGNLQQPGQTPIEILQNLENVVESLGIGQIEGVSPDETPM